MNKSYYERLATEYQHKAVRVPHMRAYYAAQARSYLFRAIDTEMYHGFFITIGEPQYGAQFAIAWGHENDDGDVHHCHTRAEARAEIDDLLHDRAEYEKAKQS